MDGFSQVSLLFLPEFIRTKVEENNAMRVRTRTISVTFHSVSISQVALYKSFGCPCPNQRCEAGGLVSMDTRKYACRRIPTIQ